MRRSAGSVVRRALFAGAVVTWGFLLYGFVSAAALLILSLVGPVLGAGGLYLAIRSARHVHTAARHIVAFVVGLLLLAGAALTLAPQARDNLLTETASGWNILEGRTRRLEKAIDAGNVRLARRLAGRGLGDTAPLGAGGRPLIHDANDAALLGALLDSGLDPDTPDTEGRTLLMNTRDAGIARALLAAGADPNARQRGGYTVLMSSLHKEPAFIDALLDAGADVHAVDEAGRSVADRLPPDGPERQTLESRAGARPLQRSGGHGTLEGARSDWLVVVRDPAAQLGPSRVELDHDPVRLGDVATLGIRISNPSPEDRRLDLEADLNGAALFVGASHDGSILNPARPALGQTIRWPALALPAHSQGRLELRLVARSDAQAGDLGVDVRVRQPPDPRENVLQVHRRLVPASQPAGTPSASWYWFGLLLAAAAVAAWLLRRRPRSPGSDNALSMAPVVLGLAAVAIGSAGLAFTWTMVEPFVSFEEASCTILDRRIRPQTTQTTTRRRSTSYAVPIVAVRIDTGAAPLIATGFATDFANRSSSELRRFPPGAGVPCWIDPSQPGRFTLVRRPSIPALVGIVLLAALTMLLGALAKGSWAPAHSSASKRRKQH